MTWPQYLRGECLQDGRVIKLTNHEALLLSILLMRRGRPTKPEDLVPMVYPDSESEPDWAVSCIALYVIGLRRKLGYDAIWSKRHFGYSIA